MFLFPAVRPRGVRGTVTLVEIILHPVCKSEARGRVYHEWRKEMNYGKVQKIG